MRPLGLAVVVFLCAVPARAQQAADLHGVLGGPGPRFDPYASSDPLTRSILAGQATGASGGVVSAILVAPADAKTGKAVVAVQGASLDAAPPSDLGLPPTAVVRREPSVRVLSNAAVVSGSPEDADERDSDRRQKQRRARRAVDQLKALSKDKGSDAAVFEGVEDLRDAPAPKKRSRRR